MSAAITHAPGAHSPGAHSPVTQAQTCYGMVTAPTGYFLLPAGTRRQVGDLNMQSSGKWEPWVGPGYIEVSEDYAYTYARRLAEAAGVDQKPHTETSGVDGPEMLWHDGAADSAMALDLRGLPGKALAEVLYEVLRAAGADVAQAVAYYGVLRERLKPDAPPPVLTAREVLAKTLFRRGKGDA